MSYPLLKDCANCCIPQDMMAFRVKFDINNGEGTVFGSINRDAMNNMEIQIPSQSVMDRLADTGKI